MTSPSLSPTLLLEPLAAPASKARPRRPKALYILFEDTLDVIYGQDTQKELAKLGDFVASPQTAESILNQPELLKDVEVVFSGWGAPKLDRTFLQAAPNLRAVFYGAGSIRHFVTDEFWARNIQITSANAANALPVAEYTLATILLSLKHFWKLTAQTRHGEGWGDHTRIVPGTFRSTVGLISCGLIARKTLELLKSFDVHRLVYCPYLTNEEAEELGVEICTMPEIFRRGDVVSLHTPLMPETEGLINGRHFSSMKEGATFINTSRGPIVREAEMLEVLRQRPDLTAVLDVCDPEPPAAGSEILTLPNIVLSPHIAGSLGPECRRLGYYMLEEFRRYLAGEALHWRVTQEMAAKMA